MTTTKTSPAASQQAAVDAALLVLKSMGLSLDDLLSAGSADRQPVPTFAEYVPVVAATLTGSTLRAYSSYRKRTVEQWGGRRLDEPTPSEVKQLAACVKANAVPRRNNRAAAVTAEAGAAGLRGSKREYLRYDQAMEAGWPIATRIIEGACRHIIADRLAVSGSRWGLDGAEAVLTLRAVISNGDFEEYWRST